MTSSCNAFAFRCISGAIKYWVCGCKCPDKKDVRYAILVRTFTCCVLSLKRVLPMIYGIKTKPYSSWYGAYIICWKCDFTSILSYWLGWYQNRVATPVTISMPWMHGGFPLILGYPHIRTLSTHYLYVSVPDGYDICVTSTLAVGRNASE